MSGVVALLAGTAAASPEAPAALALIRHLEEYTTQSAVTTGAWLGSCGRPTLHAAAVEEGDDGRLVAAVVGGDVVNLPHVLRQLGLGVGRDAAEAVIAAYRRWGSGLFARLEGVFSLGVRDDAKGLTLAGGDPDAVGAMYALALGEEVWLASEAKAFLAAARYRPRLDETVLAQLLTVGWPLAGRGLFAGVSGLPLGCHFEVREGRLALRRHWDERDALGGRLRGHAYAARMEEAIREVCRESFADPDVLVPLTGGLDSRLLVAAMPPAADPKAFTFGSFADADVQRAAEIAAARGLSYRVLDLEPNYVGRFSSATVWLSEGRTNPTGNITGCLMDRVADSRYFVSGIGGALGRRFLKCRDMLPDRRLLTASGEDFERRFFSQVWRQLLDVPTMQGLFGPRGMEYMAVGREAIADALAKTRGLPPVDRLEHYIADTDGWEERPGLALAGTWVTPRTPLHTRRWYEAVLSGAPRERIDDLARLRLIRALDAEVARVPWVLTHLSLPLSEPLLWGLRGASWAAWKWPPCGCATVKPRRTAVPAWLKHRIYSHGERRDDWLRDRSRSYLTGILLSDRAADRGIVRPEGVRRLLSEQVAGVDHARALGQLLNVELWHRLFIDGDLGAEAMAPWRRRSA